MGKRLKAEDVIEALETLLREGSGTSTEEIRDELVASWPAGDEAPIKQAVYSHLRRMEERGEVVSRRVGVDGGGQRAVWSLVPQRSAVLEEAIREARSRGDESQVAFLERLDDGRGGIKDPPVDHVDEESLLGAETPAGGPVEDQHVSNPGPEEIGPQNGKEAENGEDES